MFPPSRFPLRKKARTSFCSSLVTSLPSIIWTELEVENKLMAKLDRLFKRFFQIKAMKPLIGLGEPLAPALANTKPVLELVATDASKAPDVPGHTTECETAAAPI